MASRPIVPPVHREGAESHNPRTESRATSRRTLMFRDIHRKCTANELVQHIEQWVKVKSCDIPTAPQDRQQTPLGYAFVEFFRQQDAMLVMDMVRRAVEQKQPGGKLKGRPLHCVWPLEDPAVQGNRYDSKPTRPGAKSELISLGRIDIRWIPYLVVTVGIFTLFTAYAIAKNENHIPKGLFLVPLSFLGAKAPERYVYTGGLVFCSVLVFVSALMVGRMLAWIAHMVPKWKVYTIFAFWTGIGASVGLFVQSVVHLQPDLVDILHDPRFSQPSLPKNAESMDFPRLTTASCVHQGAAACFFLCGLLHVYLVLNIVQGLKDAPSAIQRKWPVSKTSIRLKYWSLTFLSMVPLVLVAHPVAFETLAIPLTPSLRLAVTGVSQIVVIGGLLMFFASYVHEFDVLHGVVLLGTQEKYLKSVHRGRALETKKNI